MHDLLEKGDVRTMESRSSSEDLKISGGLAVCCLFDMDSAVNPDLPPSLPPCIAP